MQSSTKILLALTLALSASACAKKPDPETVTVVPTGANLTGGHPAGQPGTDGQPPAASATPGNLAANGSGVIPGKAQAFGPAKPNFLAGMIAAGGAIREVEKGGSKDKIDAAKARAEAGLAEAALAKTIEQVAPVSSLPEQVPATTTVEKAPESDAVTPADREHLIDLIKVAIILEQNYPGEVPGDSAKRCTLAADSMIESLTGKTNVHALIQELWDTQDPDKLMELHFRRILVARGVTLPGEENNGIGADGFTFGTPTGSLKENFFQYYGQEDLSKLETTEEKKIN